MCFFLLSIFEIETTGELNLNFLFQRKKKSTKIEFDFEFRVTCYLFIWLSIALIAIYLAWYRFGYIINQQLSKTRKKF
jgi:hypothetical protein